MVRFLATLAMGVMLCAPSVNRAAAQTLRPLVYIESEPGSSARYLRVMEQSFAPFTPARSAANLPNSPRINIRDAIPTLVRNVSVSNAKYGVHVSGEGAVSIDHFNFYDWSSNDIHGGAIKVDRSGPAPTYVQAVYADGREAPDPTYDRSNTDFIGVERDEAPVLVRYATGRNWGDAGVDAKSDVSLMNVTIEGAHRGLRAWSDVTITIANSIINVPRGHEQIWLRGANAHVLYYNTLWCVGAPRPSPDAPECSYEPTAIGAEDITPAQARRQVTALNTNTLSRNPFFATQIDRVVIEYSSNGGRTWRTMAASGGSGRPPLGDLRYRIPFDLTDGSYLFRAHFERDGERVGSAATIDEAGTAPGANGAG